MNAKTLHFITFGLLVVGGLNWLLVGLTGYDIGYLLGGSSAPLSRLIYVLVGIAAVYEAINHRKHCRACEGKGMPAATPGMPQM